MRGPIFIVLVLLHASFPVILAAEESLFTSSISYCATPDVLLIQEFEFEYFKNNASVSFTLAATNTASNLNASVHVIVNDYGMTPLNYTFNLCDVLQGQLCPLPQYNVTGESLPASAHGMVILQVFGLSTGTVSLPIPSSVQIPIPEIAFKIPDLEAVAQITLRRVENGEVAVCLQSTLSNGWSLHMSAVSTATGIIALVSLLASIFYSFVYPHSSPAVFRTITTFAFFQQIALSGMLHLNFPSAYIAFVTNFAWSFGLFGESEAIQSAIERMRQGTGSSLSEESQPPAAYADRTFSPYNLAVRAVNAGSQNRSIDIGSFVGGTASQPSNSTHRFLTPVTITGSGQTLEPGIPVYVNYVNVATGNAFMTFFFTLLFLFLTFGALHLAILGCLRWSAKYRVRGAEAKLAEFRMIFASNAIPLVQVCLLPAILLAFFQWTLHDSWLPTLISVIVFLVVLSALGYPTYLIGRQVLAKGPTSLNCDTIHRSPQGALIGPFLDARYYFFLFTIIAPIIRAAFVGLARSDGFVQVIGLVTLELLYLLLLLFLRPGHTRRADVFDVTIAIIRLICTAALLPFVKEKLDVDAIPRTGIGIGIAAVLSVGVIILGLNVLLHVIPWRWAWRGLRGPKKGEEGETLSRDEGSEVEKGTASPGATLPR